MGVAKRLSSGCSDDSDPLSLTAAKKGEEDQGWIVSLPQSLSSLLAGERVIRKGAKEQFPPCHTVGPPS